MLEEKSKPPQLASLPPGIVSRSVAGRGTIPTRDVADHQYSMAYPRIVGGSLPMKNAVRILLTCSISAYLGIMALAPLLKCNRA